MADSEIVAAYCRLYTQTQVEDALRAALANFAAGVVITSVSFEGGASAGQLVGDTRDLIGILNACLERMEGIEQPSAVSHWDFSSVRLGT